MAISSPTCFSQRRRVPSSMASPILGIMTFGIGVSLSVLPIEDAVHGVDHLLLVRERRDLQITGIGGRGFRATDALHRGIEIIECLLLEDSGDLGGDAVPAPLLLYYHRPVRLAYRFDQRLLVKGTDRAQ